MQHEILNINLTNKKGETIAVDKANGKMKGNGLSSHENNKPDEFVPTMTSIFKMARWFGIPTYGGRWALLYGVVLLSMIVTLDLGAFYKLGLLLSGAFGGRGFLGRLTGSVFYCNAVVSMCLSWHVAIKWRTISSYWLCVETKGLVLPPDKSIRRRVIWITGFIGVCAIVEHALSMMSATDFNIPPDKYFQRYILSSHGFLIETYEYDVWLAIPIFMLSKYATILWNFQDLIIILISMGLASRYHRLNKIVEHAVRTETQTRKSGIDMYFRLRNWRKIREAYVQQASLVRKVDEDIGSLILLSNLNNLYCTCLQLFLGIRISSASVISTVYYYASLGWLLFRASCVMLAAADVNLQSKRALVALNSYPSSAYNIEIQRLKYQLIHEQIALSGKGFFYLDRQMLLEIVAAIVKYELILLQYG